MVFGLSGFSFNFFRLILNKKHERKLYYFMVHTYLKSKFAVSGFSFEFLNSKFVGNGCSFKFLKYLLVCHHFVQNSSCWGIIIPFSLTVSHHFDNCASSNYYQGYVGNLWKFLSNEFFQTVPPGK